MVAIICDSGVKLAPMEMIFVVLDAVVSKPSGQTLIVIMREDRG